MCRHLGGLENNPPAGNGSVLVHIGERERGGGAGRGHKSTMQMKEGFESPSNGKQSRSAVGILLKKTQNPHPLFLLIIPRAADENAASLREPQNTLFCSGTHAANIWGGCGSISLLPPVGTRVKS